MLIRAYKIGLFVNKCIIYMYVLNKRTFLVRDKSKQEMRYKRLFSKLVCYQIFAHLSLLLTMSVKDTYFFTQLFFCNIIFVIDLKLLPTG